MKSFDDLSEEASGDYDEADEWFDFDNPGDAIVGEYRGHQENCRPHDNTVIHVESDDGVLWAFWLRRGFERQYEDAREDGLSKGDLLGVKMTEGTYEKTIDGEEKEFPEYSVRYEKVSETQQSGGGAVKAD